MSQSCDNNAIAVDDITVNLDASDSVGFVQRFGALYESSPWIAERAFAHVITNVGSTLAGAGPHSVTSSQLLKALHDVVEAATHAEQLGLIRAHPDLAGRAAVCGELTDESTEEQSRARLDQCSSEEFEEFQCLNEAYKKKFQFPFIMAVRNSERCEILAAFRTRLQGAEAEEFRQALDNIHMIARLRLLASVESSA